MQLRESTIRGVVWNSIGTIGPGLINIAITIVLARILTPADFGLIALLVIFTVLSETLVESGFGQAIIRDRDATDIDLSSVFLLNVIIGISLYSILFALTPLIAEFYDESELTGLARFVFLSFVFNAFAVVQSANFSRQLNFRVQAISTFFAAIISGTVSIALAVNGYGVWSLAINAVSYSFLKTVFLWVQSSWRPTIQLSWLSIQKYFKFGKNLLVQSLVDRFVTNLELIIIGKVYTKEELGFFSQGRNLNSYLMQTISGVVQRVTYPALSKVSDENERLKSGYRSVIGIAMLVMIPLCMGIIVSAENLILVVLGDSWITSAVYLKIFIVMGLFVSLHSYYINIFLIKGETALLLKLSLLKQFIKVLVLIMVLNEGVLAIGVGVVLASMFTSLIYIYWGGSLIKYSMYELLLDLKQIIIAGLISAILTYYLNVILTNDNVTIVFVAQIVLMLSVYLSVLVLMKNIYLRELISVVTNFIGRKNV